MFARWLTWLARPALQALLRRAWAAIRVRMRSLAAGVLRRRRGEPDALPGERRTREPTLAPAGAVSLPALAEPVFVLAARIGAGRESQNLGALHQTMRAELDAFEARAQRAGLPAQHVSAARQVLAALLDDTVQSTPWAGTGRWAPHRVSAAADGAQAVFEMLVGLARQPLEHRELLLLIEAALARGLAGRYRRMSDGSAKLRATQAHLARLLAGAAQPSRVPAAEPAGTSWPAGASVDVPIELPPNAPPPSQRGTVSRRSIGVGVVWGLTWGASAACASVLAAAALWASTTSARWPWAGLPAAASERAPSARPELGLSGALSPLREDVEAGRISVRMSGGRHVVVIASDRLFSVGTAQLGDSGDAVIQRLGRLLAGSSGAVAVTGHTEAQPAATTAFSTRQQLSQARADAVRSRLVAAGVAAVRIRAEGRADTEPLTSDRSPRGSALNRRVEIWLPEEGLQLLTIASARATNAGSAASRHP